jgi:hypothetical protein
MSEERRERTFSERIVTDGPPFLAVVFLFVVLEASYGVGHPGEGLAILASGLLVAITIDFLAWRRLAARDRAAAVAGLGSLRQRLDLARQRDLEHRSRR